MAVWGTPVAQEDDAERAVRAALDLVAAVARARRPSLHARARACSPARRRSRSARRARAWSPATSSTPPRGSSRRPSPGRSSSARRRKRATEAAIAYEDAGEHELKGKAEPVALWRALRVIGAPRRRAEVRPGSSRRSSGATASSAWSRSSSTPRPRSGKAQPRLGRRHRRDRQVAPRLGVREVHRRARRTTFWWHRGRCLAYGEGVAYWALAEMVRMRARIVEERGRRESAAAKLRAVDRGARPRRGGARAGSSRGSRTCSARRADGARPRGPLRGLAALLRAAGRAAARRARLRGPAVGRRRPARLHRVPARVVAQPPALRARARAARARRAPPDLGAGGRNCDDALARAARRRRRWTSCSTGFVPGLPDELRAQILARAEGVPLYAVETVRMLLDRGLLAREGDVYRPTGPIEALDVPETLHALVAARLDGLDPEERRLLQDAAVLGKTFTKTGARGAHRAGRGRSSSRCSRRSSARRCSRVQADPRSPERGQYGFLQDLLQARRLRDARRSRSARPATSPRPRYLEQAVGAGEQEIVEVVAAHYLDAYRAAPDADDAAEIKAQGARDARRGRASAPPRSRRTRRPSATSSRPPSSPIRPPRRPLRERAGGRPGAAGNARPQRAHFERAPSCTRRSGLTHPAARVRAARRGRLAGRAAREALERHGAGIRGPRRRRAGRRSRDARRRARPAPLLRGRAGAGVERDRARRSRSPSRSGCPRCSSQALNTKGCSLGFARALRAGAGAATHYASSSRSSNDLAAAALRAYINLGDLLDRARPLRGGDRAAAAGRELARRAGIRLMELNLVRLR